MTCERIGFTLFDPIANLELDPTREQTGDVRMRLVTRGNLDGLTCSVLIDHAERLEDIELIHPQDITDDKFDVKPGDILLLQETPAEAVARYMSNVFNLSIFVEVLDRGSAQSTASAILP